MQLATYNIQFGLGKDGEIDIDRIARELNNADIIALQEVERFWDRSLNLDEVKEIAELFPDHYYVYGPGIDLNAGYRSARRALVSRRKQFGNMILSRYPILSSRNHLLYHRVEDPAKLTIQRAAIEATIMTELGALRILSTHLSHSSAADRERQIRQLQQRLADGVAERGVLTGDPGAGYWKRDPQPAPFSDQYIVMGDFNLTPGFPEYQMLTDKTSRAPLVDLAVATGQDGPSGWTCEEEDGRNRIDYVFCSPGLVSRVTSLHVDHAATGSDHQPVFATLSLLAS
ncbi:MAG: endonuclease/exonuclease/phosphatase family protein [Rhodospirillales bacterium]